MIRTVFALALCCALAAADAPTKDEWDPVIKAVATGDADADAKLGAITDRYPTWPDAWVERSRLAVGAKKADDGWKYAREALKLQRTNGDAAALGVQALTAMGRPADALKVAESFRTDRSLDKQSNGKAGYVNYYAAVAARAAKDAAGARDRLAVAMACAGNAVPADFQVLDARLAIDAGDLAKAESSLARATTADPRAWDAWYELGRVRHALAEADTGAGGKRNWLDGAETAFATVTKALPDDYESWLGLGRAQAAIARLEIDAGGDGGGRLRDAAASLGEAVRRKDDLVAGWVTLGEVQVRLDQNEEAVTSLTKARALGADQPSVLHNLAQALQKSGKGEESVAVLKGVMATSGSELVSQGMGYYRNHLYPVAIQSLETAAAHADLAKDERTRGQVLRFVGHAWREWGDGIGGDGKPMSPGPTPVEREERRAKAAAAYRAAGDLRDVMAQRHYAALMAADGPQSAYSAGWTVLGWNAWLSGSGWALVLGNYGAARAWDNPLHYIIWGVLAGVPLILWLKSIFRPKPRRERPASEEGSTKPPSARATRTGSEPRIPTPRRETDPLTTRKNRPASEPPRRLQTTEDAQPKKPAGRGSEPGKRRAPVAETEEIPKPKAKPR